METVTIIYIKTMEQIQNTSGNISAINNVKFSVRV